MDYVLNHICIFLFFFLIIFFLLLKSPFLCDLYYDSMYIISRDFSCDNILQLCDHFYCSTFSLCFSVIAVTLLNNVSILLAVITILVFFSLRKINTIVSICTTLVARPLELKFNIEEFFILYRGFCFRMCSH